MRKPGRVPDVELAARQLACHQVVTEVFARLDAGDLDGALALYADDAELLGARGRPEIKAAMMRGMAPNAGKRTRHVISNLRARAIDDSTMLVEYTAVTYTLDGPGPYAPRSILDQEQELRADRDGVLRVVRHRIFGFEPD
jgi:ketosteroid isomerase-like protein